MAVMDRQRAARAVTARRGQLGLTQQELADAAGVDIKTIGNLESRGRWPIARTRARIENALGWQAGEMQRISETAPEPAPEPDVLAEEFGEDNAARLRRVLGKRGETGAMVLAAIEDEFRSPREDAAQGESRQSRAAG